MADIKVTTSTTEKTKTGPTRATESTRARHTWVRSAIADRMSAWHVRDFVKAMDEAGVPDGALVEASRSNTGHLTALTVSHPEAIDEPEAPDAA